MNVINPLFKHFGSKWGSTRAGIYPAPKYESITDHYCGAAGYPLNFWDLKVELYDSDPMIRDLWTWLIEDATEALVKEIPLRLPEGTDIRELGMSYGQQLLLKHWQRTNNVGACWTVSSWGDKPGQWTANTRSRVSEQIDAVKHWRFLPSAPDFCRGTTHFIDPPYKGNYKYRQPLIDYEALAKKCIEGRGQRIVCEGRGKDGSAPTWLPFKEAGERVTCARKQTQSHHRMEYVWSATK